MHRSAPPRKSSHPQSTAAPAAAIAAVIAGNCALAFGALFVRLADVGPVAAGFWRIALALPVLTGIALAFGGAAAVRNGGRGLALVLALAGVAFAADLAAWHLGILRTTLANATLFGNSATLIYPIYGFLVARAWPSRTQGAALLLAAVGAALLLGRSAELSPRNLAGDLLSLLAGLLYTVYFILMARVRERMAPMPALALSSLATAPVLLVAALAMGERMWPENWMPLFGLALTSQIIGQTLMIYALGHLSPLIVGIALLIQPIVAAAIGWIAYGERLAMADAIGASLVALAFVLVRRATVAPAAGTTRAKAEGAPR